MGYDRFYGFIGGETNKWYPDLAEDNHYIDQPYLPEDGYHLSKDLADKALRFIRDSKQSEPDKPWYLWFCPGANHAPHHAPQEFIDKYKGKFDDGYEAYREWVLPRMIERGILPEGTELTPINPMPEGTFAPGDAVRPWDALSDEEKALFCRMAEVYAGFSEYTDHQVGRIVDYLEESGQLDNTIIFYCADNGASGEGSPNGSVNEGKFFNAWPDTIEDNLPLLDKLGSAGDLQPLPDRLGGGVLDAVPDVQALHVPGRRLRPAGDPLAQRDQGRGEVRDQYHHSTDIVPTILECCGVEMPEVVNGVEQTPLAGVSMRYWFDAARRADAEGDAVLRDVRQARHLAQGLEGGHRARPDQRAGQLREGPLAALPHRRGPLRGARPRRRSTRRRSRSSTTLWFEEAKEQRAAAQRHAVVGKDLEKFLEMEFKIPVPPSGQYTYYPGTTEVPERRAANVHGVSYKVARRGRVHPATRRA